MSFTIDINKVKSRTLVCEKYIDVDSYGYLEFKGSLLHAINNENISKDDALLICLELMHLINNENLNYETIKPKFKQLIQTVKRYNNIKNQYLKDKLFNKDYSIEKGILLEYIDNLPVRHNSFEDKPSKNKLNEIKSCLIDLDFDDLCYILGINPELTFEKDKILKKRIANEFIKYPVDLKKLENSSAKEIKNYLALLKDHNYGDYTNNLISDIHIRVNEKAKKHEEHMELRKKQYLKSNKKIAKPKAKKEIEKVESKNVVNKSDIILNPEKITKYNQKPIKKTNENHKVKKAIKSDAKDDASPNFKSNRIEILDKIDEFNHKSLQTMILSRSEYSKTYNEIIRNIAEYEDNKEVQKFKYFYTHLEKIKKANALIEEISEYDDNFDEFYNEATNDGYLSYSKRKNLIDKYRDIYNNAVIVNDYQKCLRNKITDEFKNLSYFLECYEDLQEYTTLKDTDNNNHVKYINELYVQNEIKDNEPFFKDIQDVNKIRAIVNDEDNIKVVAGAGAGKTFIIQKKVKYLIEKRKVDPKRILCLCYTKKSVDQLHQSIKKSLKDSSVKVFTFHEFCRRVDEKCGGDKSSNRYLLDGIIRRYVADIVSDSKKLANLSEYFSYYALPQPEIEKFETLEEYEKYEEDNRIVSLKKKYYQCTEDIETVKGEKVKSIGELLIANYLFMHEIDYEYERKYPFNYFSDMIKYGFLDSGIFFSLEQISDIPNHVLVQNFIDWEAKRKESKPDFYLPKYDIYLEHFGVDENMEATFLEGSEKEKYEMSMRAKEVFHELYGTKLIETFYFYLAQDRLLKELEELLRQKEVEIGQMPKEEIVNMLIKNKRINDFENFTKLVKSFINIYESKHVEKMDFKEFRKNNNAVDIYDRKRQNLFFNIVEDIYNDYYDENINGTLSHNHEIINALKLIKNKEFKQKYDYIFIDEYQDINPVRCQLLQELQKNSGSKIFVVGDDWQSIYGFSGSEVGLFIDFHKYFKHPETIVIEENRRNPQKLIDVSSQFVVNKSNLKRKKLKYYKKDEDNNDDPIKIVKYNKKNILDNPEEIFNENKIKEYKKLNRESKILKLEAIIEYILSNSKDKNPEILILGRNNDDIDDYLGNILFIEKTYGNKRKIEYYNKPDLDITFMTVHQSKGLEKDEVIVLNLEDSYAGFPNKMVDDPILSFVKYKDEYEFAEERRLFYVALTRTKNNVFLLAPVKQSSTFVKELISDFEIEFSSKDFTYISNNKVLFQENDFFKKKIHFPTNMVCPKCGKGIVEVILNNFNWEGKRTKYVRCSNCDYDGGPYPASLNDVKYVKKCPKCTRGVLVRQGDVLRCSLNYHEMCEGEEPLILDEEELKFDYE